MLPVAQVEYDLASEDCLSDLQQPSWPLGVNLTMTIASIIASMILFIIYHIKVHLNIVLPLISTDSIQKCENRQYIVHIFTIRLVEKVPSW